MKGKMMLRAVTAIVTVRVAMLLAATSMHVQSGYAAFTKSNPTILATSSNNVYTIWSSNKTGNCEISFRASPDNGKTFGPEINPSNDTSDSTDHRIVASENNVYITSWNTLVNKTGIREPVMRIINGNCKHLEKG